MRNRRPRNWLEPCLQFENRQKVKQCRSPLRIARRVAHLLARQAGVLRNERRIVDERGPDAQLFGPCRPLSYDGRGQNIEQVVGEHGRQTPNRRRSSLRHAQPLEILRA